MTFALVWGPACAGVGTSQYSEFVELSLPRQKRSVDHIRDPVPAYGLDRQGSVLQAEPMRRYKVKREAGGRNLLEREFARAIAVTVRALDRDGFYGHFLQRKFANLLHFSLHEKCSVFSLEGFDAEQNRNGARTCRAVQ